jgi:hypothetical protein
MTNPVAAGYGPRRKAGGLFVVTDQQVRKLMDTHAKTGLVGRAADKAGMDRKTARKYLKQGKMPSQMKAPRAWRTREDPFTADWPRVVEMLEDAPELEAKALFEYLLSISASGAYEPGQLRSFQRRVHTWRAAEGPEKEIFFAQCHVPGEAMQTDFTWATELGVTIQGQPFPHLLCHMVLPYSNWEWARADLQSPSRKVVCALWVSTRRQPCLLRSARNQMDAWLKHCWATWLPTCPTNNLVSCSWHTTRSSTCQILRRCCHVSHLCQKDSPPLGSFMLML